MRLLKNIFNKIYLFIIWALITSIFWCWIFTFANDAPTARKIAVYCQVPMVRDTELAVKLEENLPDGIEKIKVHSFNYVMFDVESIENGDIFILPESLIGEYSELLLDPEGGEMVRDKAAETASAADFITYDDENYYLFLGAKSAHLEDGAARAVADVIISLN